IAAAWPFTQPRYIGRDLSWADWLALPDIEGPAMRVFLETDRLVLRQFTSADADNLVSLDADPDVMRYVTGGTPTSREEIESEVLPAFLGYYQRYEGYGFWAVIEKETGEFLGWFHFRPLGSPFSRSKLRPWLRSVAGCTTHARSASFRPGSAPMPTAWTIWSGCAGHTGSNAPGATALEAGGRV